MVLALPFSLLRASVDLTRAGLSARKLVAIDELGMGTNSKLHLQFTQRRWNALGNTGDSYADTGYQATRAQPGASGILVYYTGGRIGAGMNRGTVQERARIFLAQIEPVMPGVSANYNGKATLDYWTGIPGRAAPTLIGRWGNTPASPASKASRKGTIISAANTPRSTTKVF